MRVSIRLEGVLLLGSPAASAAHSGLDVVLGSPPPTYVCSREVDLLANLSPLLLLPGGEGRGGEEEELVALMGNAEEYVALLLWETP